MKPRLSRLLVGAAGASIMLGGLSLPASATIPGASPLFPPPAPDVQNAVAQLSMNGSTVQSGCGGGGGAYTEADGTFKGVINDGGSLQTPLTGTLTANVTMVGGNGVGSPWIMTGDLSMVDLNGFPVFTGTPFTFPAEQTGARVITARGEITPMLYGTYELLANVTLTADLNNNTLTGALGNPFSQKMYAVEWNGTTCTSGGAPNVQRAGAKFAIKVQRKPPTTRCPGLQQHLTTTVSPAVFAGSQSDAGSAPIPLFGPLTTTVGYTLDTVSNRAIMHLQGSKSTSGGALGYTFDFYAPATRAGGAVTALGELVGKLGASGYTLFANIRVDDPGNPLIGAFGPTAVGPQRLTSHEWNLGFCAPF